MADAKKSAFFRSLGNPAWIAFIWFGMTFGIGAISTPARFSVPSITRPVALDVGRAVFSMLNRAEIVALIVLLIVIRFSGRARRWWLVCGALALILIAQTAWLLPELSARGAEIIAGREPPPSMAHGIYTSLELVKLGLLAYLGFSSIAAGSRSHENVA